MSRFLRDWGPAVLWAAGLFALSSRPALPVDLASGRDKIVHFAAYAVLGALLARGQIARHLPAMVAVLLGVVYAASDEIHQAFVPNRSADIFDWVADALGVIAGVLLVTHLARVRSRRAAAPHSVRRPSFHE